MFRVRKKERRNGEGVDTCVSNTVYLYLLYTTVDSIVFCQVLMYQHNFGTEQMKITKMVRPEKKKNEKKDYTKNILSICV